MKWAVFFMVVILGAGHGFCETWDCEDGMNTIDLDWKCDGQTDCLDGSDEMPDNCKDRNCMPDHFTCDSGRCIPQGLICNGEIDCGPNDSSDESGCAITLEECDTTLYHFCDDYCLPKEWVCDGDKDCSDKSDEASCSTECKPGNVKCNNTGLCINQEWLCDGEIECADGEDERNCSAVGNDVQEQPIQDASCDIAEFSCGDGVCLSVLRSCDGKGDCTNGEDEGAHCHQNTCRLRKEFWKSSSSHSSLLCDHGCRPTPQGPKCYCYSGYELELDGFRCRIQGLSIAALLVADDNHIRSLSLAANAFVENDFYVNRNTNVEILGITVNSGDGSIIWSHLEDGKVKSIGQDGSHNTIVSAENAAGIGFDWIGKNLYVAHTSNANGGDVGVVSLSRQVSTPNEPHMYNLGMNLLRPVSLALHPRKGLLVLVDYGNESISSSLVRANMDGTELSFLTVAKERRIHCVTVDQVTDVIYWTESSAETARIEMMTLNGVHRKTLVSKNSADIFLDSPFSVAAFHNHLYFSDNGSREIWSVDSLSGKPVGLRTDYLNPFPLLKASLASHLLAICLNHPILQQTLSTDVDDCVRSSCSHMCVIRAMGFRCLCPTTMYLADDNKNCIEAETTSPQLSTIKLAASATDVTTPTVQSTASPVVTFVTNASTTEAKPSTVNVSHPKIISTSVPVHSTTCPKPVLNNNTFTIPLNLNAKTFPVDFRIEYYCLPGWHMKGLAFVERVNQTCTSTGRWDVKAPSCVSLTCRELQCGPGGKCSFATPYDTAMCLCSDGSLSFSCLNPTTAVAANTTTDMPLGKSLSSNTNVGLIVGLLFALVALAFCSVIVWRYSSSRKRHGPRRGPLYTPKKEWNRRSDHICDTSLEELSDIDKNSCITNPNYSSPRKTRIRLPLPDDMDSGLERSTSSLSSSEDSPAGTYNYQFLKETADTVNIDGDRIAAEPEMDILPGPQRSVRKSLSTIFHMRKTESQEHMLPPC
ncbi:uncharacterized protein LOC143471056 isoform X2 [Clavelina lepadiformis]|uniref:uncharacterized protein LOC143471056 isoform X2 n=1 Tax=Clavelina lepadiformis TaxID=159417 RepID=UPI0040429AB1